VSVVVPTRGRPELLRETLASIVAQDYHGDLEVLVVHDQEPPDHGLERLGAPGRSVTPLSNDRTPGLAGARNSGVTASHGTFVASCDDDDLWHVSKISRQVELLTAEPHLVAVGSGIRLLMGAGRTVEWTGRESVVTHRRLLGSRVKELHSSTLLIRREVLDAVGLYDEDLPHGYGEDYDFLLRATRLGPAGVVDEILADIRKDVPSWFRDRALNTASALEYLLEKHPDFREHRRGHARLLGQIAYARASAGDRNGAARLAGRALTRYPAAPQAWLALTAAGPGVDPHRVLLTARRLGRGVS
jgi:glycosyltransferase involved in cell wall biosynthesis